MASNYDSKYDDDDVDITVKDQALQKLSKFTKIISPIFILFALTALVLMILSIVGIPSSDDWSLFMINVLATIIFAIVAALGVWKWGTVEEQIDGLKRENAEYEFEIERLKKTKKELNENVSELSTGTQQLQRNVKALEETLSQYDDLKEELQNVVGSSQEVSDLVKSVNAMYDGMKDTILQSERASILSAYYDAALRDRDRGMDKSEYTRFLNKLENKTRNMFKARFSFEKIAGDDGTIDLNEFQRAVDEILEQQEKDLISEQVSKGRNK
jgi:septal ring factor EnvC (AmiA/AmiB activator)